MNDIGDEQSQQDCDIHQEGSPLVHAYQQIQANVNNVVGVSG